MAMKKSSLTLVSLLAVATSSFAQMASDMVGSGSELPGTHTFIENGVVSRHTLCTHEICHLTEEGTLRVEFVPATSPASIIAQTSKANSQKYLVFYPAGQEGKPKMRRVLRNRYLLVLKDGADLKAIQARCGIKSIKLVRKGSNLAICEEESAARALSQLTNVQNDPQIVAAEPIFARTFEKQIIPTDPLYAPSPITDNIPGFLGVYQWYLNNEGLDGAQAGIDINFENVPNSVTGSGVTVAVVDDGVAIDHEDLETNATGPHLNLFPDGGNGDPATLDVNANHGTAVAGLIAAELDNGLGISGVAPGSTLSGIRFLPATFEEALVLDDVDVTAALGFSLDQIDIYNNSWGYVTEPSNLSYGSRLMIDALENGVETGRGGNGAIYVFSAGNSGEGFERADYASLQSSKYTIAVGALADSGEKSFFSEEGACLVVTAPSNGGSSGIVTSEFGVDLDEDDQPFRTSLYTPSFGGTSASCPIVSGVIALMLEAEPTLNWREVQDVLIRSAVEVDPGDSDWITNAAGLSFNHKFGAGLVDAAGAVALASSSDLVRLGPVQEKSVLRNLTTNPNDPNSESGFIPDNEGGSLIVSLDMSQGVDESGATLPNLKVEHAELTLFVVAERRTELEIILVSPNGTQSLLQTVDADNTEQGIFNYTFTTVRNWGEGSDGIWTVRITDRISGNPANLVSAELNLSGVIDPDAPVGDSPVLISATGITVDQGTAFSYFIEAARASTIAVGDLPDGVTFDPIENEISGAFSDAGLFSIPIILTDENGVESTFTLRAVVRPTAAVLGDAIGFAGIPAVSGGDAPWIFERNDSNSGGSGEDGVSVRSGVGLADGESSVFGFNNLGEGVLIFDWKSSSEEGADRLWFNRGGEVPHEWDAFISGARNWTTTAVVLTDSSNDVRWIYSKDPTKPFANTAGGDAGFVDNLRLVETDKFMDDLVAAGPIQGFEPEFDSRAIFYPRETGGASGGLAIVSPSIGNGQTVSISTWVEGPGNFIINGFLISEPEDVFELLIDGALMDTVEGAGVDLALLGGATPTINVPIQEGRHRVQFRFRKGFSGTTFGELDGEPFEGLVLDDLSFIPSSNFTSFLEGVDQTLDDGDGYSFFEEYAFGGDHTDFDTPKYLPTIVESGGNSYIEYGFNTSLTNLDYTAQQSSNLVDWVDAQLTTLNRMEGDVAVYRIPISSQAGRSRLFFRVMAEER